MRHQIVKCMAGSTRKMFIPVTRGVPVSLSASWPINQRHGRIAVIMLGVAVYTIFCLSLVRYGYLQAETPAFSLLMGIWIAGLLVLLLADGSRHGRFDASALTLTKAVWCNLGVVITALLVPHPVRLLFLVVPLFGILYTALHLDRRQMIFVSLVTWLTYLAGNLLLIRYGDTDLAFEALIASAFTVTLGCMVYMAGEVTALRSAFDRRRDRLNEANVQLAELAMRDELTGLYNRRYIMEVLKRQKALADRGHVGFTLCYCDLDHFKRVNDRFGHPRGDKVLHDFADLAAGAVRSVDFVARIGGEEFLLVLVGADTNVAANVTQRLREHTREMCVVPEDADFRITVSIGIATFRTAERIEDVIQRADQALFRAKSEGRDGIIVAA
ncbi:MAG: GGDEF domain-containing protein [Gammaproteobacteria bacterium]|nr:GGDEF domain-containing protein [Gammaproteobacteria bacterium]